MGGYNEESYALNGHNHLFSNESRMPIVEITDPHTVINVLGLGSITQILEMNPPSPDVNERNGLIDTIMKRMSTSVLANQFIIPLVVEWHEDEVTNALSIIIFEHPNSDVIIEAWKPGPLYMLGQRCLVFHTTYSQSEEGSSNFTLRVDYYYGPESEIPENVARLFNGKDFLK